MAKYKLGETVQLRSGGPEMTIINIIEGQNPGQRAMYVIRWKAENPSADVWYQTQWFESTNLKKEIFIEGALDSSEIE